MKLDSEILWQWSASYNSSQTKMLYCQVHGKLISKASREALTCYISSLKSIGSAVAELQSSKVKLLVTCHAPIGIQQDVLKC